MQYNGIELKEITEPQVFNPPKKMLVWNDLSHKPKEANVVAIIPQFSAYGNMNVIGPYDGVGSGYNSYYAHCAEIPEELKPRRATNRELAKWLAQGNGEMTFKSKRESDIDHLVFTSHIYEEEFADEECDKALKRNEDGSWIVVRKWEDTEWHDPTADYLGHE